MIFDENYQKEAVIFVDGMEYVVKRIDVHHFSMDDKKRPGHPVIWHIGQLHYDCPYKEEITKWLRDDSVDISLREYHWEKQ
ncbi:MAG: hypothetical protein PHS04_18095 [Tissierellia bacterium]|nr:hypothetical protein [Tissierellia bacterium]